MDFFYSLFGLSTIEEEDDGKKKKAQVLYSGSVQTQAKWPDVSLQRVRSNIGDSAIDEDEMVASFTNIETPIESDSAIGSAEDENDDSGKFKGMKQVRRVESKKYLMDDEEYLVVDFIGNVEVTSKKATKVEEPSTDSSPLNKTLNKSLNSSSFEEISDNETDTNHMKVSEMFPNDVELSSDDIETSGGLKGFKKKQEEVQSKNESKSDKEVETKPIVKKSNSNTDDKGLTNEDGLQWSSSTRELTQGKKSANVERSSSQKSNEFKSPVCSIVLQNKLLFDQRISSELKTKYPSMQSLDSRKRSGQLDLSHFERQDRLGSFNNKTPVLRSQSDADINVAGIVAGARSMFEIGGGGSKRLSKVDQDVRIKDDKEKEALKEKEEIKKLPRKATSDNKERATFSENPLLSHYKAPEPIKTSKKKKFPFKKKKVDEHTKAGVNKFNVSGKQQNNVNHDNVELVSVQINSESQHLEERAIDVPASLFNPKAPIEVQEETHEKKKKSIFSRMKKVRKGSDSDQKYSLDRKHSKDKHVDEGIGIKHSIDIFKNQHSRDASERKHAHELSEKQPEIKVYSIEIEKQHSIESQQIKEIISQEVNKENTEDITNIPSDIINKSEDTDNRDTPSEISLVLGSIIDRSPSFQDSVLRADGSKKKRLGFKKKKKTSNVDQGKNSIETAKASTEIVAPTTEIVASSTENDAASTEIVTPSTEIVTPSTEIVVPSTQTISSLTEIEAAPQDLTEVIFKEGEISPTEVIHTNKLVSDWSIDTVEDEEELSINIMEGSKIKPESITELPEEERVKIDEQFKGKDVFPQLLSDETDVTADLHIIRSSAVIKKKKETSDNKNSDINTMKEGEDINPQAEPEVIDVHVVADKNDESTANVSINNVTNLSLDLSVQHTEEHDEDDLVSMLNQASPLTTPVTPEKSQFSVVLDGPVSLNGPVVISPDKEKKKKKFFHNPLKIKKKHKTEMLDVSFIDSGSHDDSFSLSKELKKKRAKSMEFLDISPNVSRTSSMSHEHLDRLSTDSPKEELGEEKSKKKKTSFFRKKKKSDNVKSTSFISYTDNNVTVINMDNEASLSFQNKTVNSEVTLQSSDEFQIPEDNTNGGFQNGSTNRHSNIEIKLTNENEENGEKIKHGPNHQEFGRSDELVS